LCIKGKGYLRKVMLNDYKYRSFQSLADLVILANLANSSNRPNGPFLECVGLARLANIRQPGLLGIAKFTDICQPVLLGLARLANIRQPVLLGLARLADICQRPFLTCHAKFARVMSESCKFAMSGHCLFLIILKSFIINHLFDPKCT
jgi:hypothetical protein